MGEGGGGGGGGRGSMEEIEGRRRGMLATGEWCNPVSKMLHHVKWAFGTRGLRIVAAFWAGIPSLQPRL